MMLCYWTEPSPAEEMAEALRKQMIDSMPSPAPKETVKQREELEEGEVFHILNKEV